MIVEGIELHRSGGGPNGGSHFVGHHSGDLGIDPLCHQRLLGDIDRWWTRHGDRLATGSEIGELYRLLHQAAVEAQAARSLLAESGDGTRVFSIRAALVPMALLLIEKDGDIIVLDVRIPTQR